MSEPKRTKEELRTYSHETVRGLVDQRDAEIAALKASHAELVKVLENIRDQVIGGKPCFYGDHTGFEPQFTFIQTQHWEDILENAKEALK